MEATEANAREFVVAYTLANYDHLREIAAETGANVPTEKDLEAKEPGAVRMAARYAWANLDDLKEMRGEDIGDTGESRVPTAGELRSIAGVGLDGRCPKCGADLEACSGLDVAIEEACQYKAELKLRPGGMAELKMNNDSRIHDESELFSLRCGECGEQLYSSMDEIGYSTY
ncbi:MAG: hypothetical protein KKA28_18760 [Planctomycetes bacterium]|nr:hypothetical protein [Planctomycetota bacterium]